VNSEPLFDRNLSFSLADDEPRKLKNVLGTKAQAVTDGASEGGRWQGREVSAPAKTIGRPSSPVRPTLGSPAG